MKEEREDVRNFAASLGLVEPLNPHNAFCGGRTNFIIWLTLPQERRLITMILHPSIRSSIRMLSILLTTDTDSVIFSSLPHENNPPLDDFLDDSKDELGEDNFISEFASAGLKNYGYLTKKEKECKVRGISLNSDGSKQLNYQVLRQNALDKIQRPLDKT